MAHPDEETSGQTQDHTVILEIFVNVPEGAGICGWLGIEMSGLTSAL